jgi:hypothetical protein
MSDDVAPIPAAAIRFGSTPASPPAAPANALRLALTPGHAPGDPPLVANGFWNLGVDVLGRYTGRPPAPVLVVAVARATGRVHLANLVADDEIPPRWRGGAAAAPTLSRADGSTKGISEQGFFTVDLKRHLALADRPDTYDVFLWLEDVVSDVVSADKPDEHGARPGSALFEQPASIATVKEAPPSDGLAIAAAAHDGARLVRGGSGAERVSIVAHAIESGASGSVVLAVEPGHGMTFEIDVKRLVPRASAKDRVLVLALAGGKRSPLLSIAPLE